MSLSHSDTLIVNEVLRSNIFITKMDHLAFARAELHITDQISYRVNIHLQELCTRFIFDHSDDFAIIHI